MIHLPDYLYDPGDSLSHGGVIRACGYFMRLRLEHLLKQSDGEVGLRRAMHTCALIEVVHNTFEENRLGPRSDKLFGFFNRALTEQVVQRLKDSKATLRDDELHYANFSWWNNLDRERTSLMLEVNLLRMLSDEPTMCLLLGIELQVLLDIKMRLTCGNSYPSLVAKYATVKHPTLVIARDKFVQVLKIPLAA